MRDVGRIMAAWLLMCGTALAGVPGVSTAVTPQSIGAQTALGILNAADFGLVCNGTTDNAPALGALQSRLQLAASPPVVYFPAAPLPCLTSAPLAAVSGVTYRADPGTVTIKATPGSGASPLLVSVVNAAKVLFYGITFDGNLPSVPANSNVVTVYQSSGILFDHVTVQHTRGIGILFSSAIVQSGVTSSVFNDVGNYYKVSGLASDQQQGVAFCCGVNGTVSTAQSAAGPTLATASTAGMAVGNLVSGDYIQSGSFITAISANASITLSQPTTAARAAASTFIVSSNDQNFVTNSSFTGTGIDAISFANQTGFTATGNHCLNVGGVFATGGACIYGTSGYGAVVNANIAAGTLGNGYDLIRVGSVAITGNLAVRSGGSGVAYAAASGAAITGNTVVNSNQAGQTTAGASRAGFFLSGAKAVGDPPVANVSFSGNTALDDQATPTQAFGFQAQAGSTLSGIYLDQNNVISGYATSAFGEALTGYSVPVSVAQGLTQTGSSPNLGELLGVTGNGSLAVGTHDGTTAGGNAAGTYAIDLGMSRSAIAQVASADHATILGGANNTAAGQFSTVVAGQWNSVYGAGSVALGEFGQDRYRSGTVVMAANLNAVNGDAQSTITTLHLTTTSTTATRLVAAQSQGGGGTPSTSNCDNLPNINFPTNQEAVYGFSLRIVATDLTTPGSFLHYYEPAGTLYKTTTLATTVYAASGNATTKTVGTAGTVTVAADTTYGCPAITWTAPNADTWHVVARIDAVEGF